MLIRDKREQADYERQKAETQETEPENQQSESKTMSGRPRNRAAVRDGVKEGDVEAELLTRIMDGLRQAKKHNDESRRLGDQIMALEEEIKTVGCTIDVSRSQPG